MKWHWPWQHEFEVVSAERVLSDYLGDGTKLAEGIGTHETLVLLRCACGKVKTKKLRGHWNQESLNRAFGHD